MRCIESPPLPPANLAVGLAGLVVRENVVHHVVRRGEGHAHIAVGAAIVHGDTAGIRVLKGGAGEADVGHEAPLLVPLLRGQKERIAAVKHPAGLVDVQDRAADGVNIAVAGPGDAVVEEEPALVRLDGRGPAADFQILPPVAAPAHDVAVAAPELHVRALAEEDVAEGRVAGVGGAGEHGIHAVYLPGEEDRVAVEGDEGIFNAGEGPEVPCLRHADGRAVEILAPDDIIGILHFH